MYNVIFSSGSHHNIMLVCASQRCRKHLETGPGATGMAATAMGVPLFDHDLKFKMSLIKFMTAPKIWLPSLAILLFYQ